MTLVWQYYDTTVVWQYYDNIMTPFCLLWHRYDCHGTGMTILWDYHETIMIPIWHYYDTTMTILWDYHDTIYDNIMTLIYVLLMTLPSGADDAFGTWCSCGPSPAHAPGQMLARLLIVVVVVVVLLQCFNASMRWLPSRNASMLCYSYACHVLFGASTV